MASAQRDIAANMIAQLRLLDPSASAEVGTPERKIIDTVAQALYDSQVDLGALQQGLDVDSKYGSALDRFLGIFGFNRQKPTFATGYVTFSRITASNTDIRIAGSTTVQAIAESTSLDTALTNVPFVTLFDATLAAGQLSATVPVRCTVAGAIGNVGAERITKVVGSAVYGISAVTNEQPITGGLDAETDEEYKVRFKNTIFRNLAGTSDQFLALAVATAFTAKANVVGPVSTYREYIQVPPVDDASSYDPTGDVFPIGGNGNAGEYTTALSTIPYAKYIYAVEQPTFITNGDSGPGAIFYRQDVDYTFNGLQTPNTSGGLYDVVKDRGDTYRLPNYNLDSHPTPTTVAPNVTFRNIYTGVNANVQAIHKSDVLLLEFSYLSQASRADVSAGIFNTVDVYIDGGNLTSADTVVSRPTTSNAFIDSIASKYHFENYRRVGEPEKRPVIGNIFQPLFWQPVTDVPDQIIVGTNIYIKGQHYWAIEDITNLGGTVRSRTGLEWSNKLPGKLGANTLPDTYSGQLITISTPDATDSYEVLGYEFDRNIVDLQASFDGSKQVTTDALAHKARLRYFKLDITVMYAQGFSVTEVNSQVRDAVNSYLRSQFFGSAVQLSDLLQIIHAVPGVDNVRWTADSPGAASTVRVIETDIYGKPLLSVSTDRIQWGNGTVPEIEGLYLAGGPTDGTFKLLVPATLDSIVSAVSSTSALSYAATAANIQTAINTIIGGTNIAVVEDIRSNTNVLIPMRSFRMQYINNNRQTPVTVSDSSLVGGKYVFSTDFFLRDNELARLPVSVFSGYGTPDTVAGLIIRPRAQNTWTRTR